MNLQFGPRLRSRGYFLFHYWVWATCRSDYVPLQEQRLGGIVGQRIATHCVGVYIAKQVKATKPKTAVTQSHCETAKPSPRSDPLYLSYGQWNWDPRCDKAGA